MLNNAMPRALCHETRACGFSSLHFRGDAVVSSAAHYILLAGCQRRARALLEIICVFAVCCSFAVCCAVCELRAPNQSESARSHYQLERDRFVIVIVA